MIDAAWVPVLVGLSMAAVTLIGKLLNHITKRRAMTKDGTKDTVLTTSAQVLTDVFARVKVLEERLDTQERNYEEEIKLLKTQHAEEIKFLKQQYEQMMAPLRQRVTELEGEVDRLKKVQL